ncbi:MacB family efflux pump subunit (plasmid) [Agrobacterium salinitolerans]|uniref:MacB family efflux pump subunit n=1 Tax=Agrobacterium salinitolerans TaxID=1183413 RepID=UPI001C2478D0|nr:MacB family efflux pump subunit [Agrobacterium salinitolerans]QXC53172.1 MacB family efflux pump subunit [Agrobacterium salinitolerans]
MTPLIQIDNVYRSFVAGGEKITALNGVSLTIEAGELVAIVGASGSGKSTLMNILGCLDQPTEGEYLIDGKSVSGLTADELAALRREHFGFIFQRYHLLGPLKAIENVAMPAVYAGLDAAARHRRAKALLDRLGLGERLDHRPRQLSGGQQQRVSIARALMNGGEIILADEPTGALDSKSGENVLDILKELHGEGHTVIMVTHDMQVAANADRIIEIRDGRIVSDQRTRDVPEASITPPARDETPVGRFPAFRQRLSYAAPMALRSMAAHRIRTFLTMLGIIIGIAAVVCVVGLGEGSRQKVLAQMIELGASTLSIYPGRDWGDERAANITSLVIADAEALSAQSYVRGVTPLIYASARARSDHASLTANINGVGHDYFTINGMKLIAGRGFSSETPSRLGQQAILDDRTAAALFPNKRIPLGRTIMIDRMPATVVGVVQRPRSAAGDRTLQIYVPHSSVAGRVSGTASSLGGLTVRVADGVDTAAAERAIVNLVTRRHGTKDFYVFNSDQMRKALEKTSRTMALLISSVAVISLIVGGIGVMNIMLVSVTERTREIGLRMAVGARRLDILLQFLIEAVLICLAGSVVGIALAFAIAAIIGDRQGEMPMIISMQAVLGSCVVAFLIGLTFGFLPARNAARLDPVDALSRE